jgi:predicted DNA-binding transcriptional regulator YafY
MLKNKTSLNQEELEKFLQAVQYIGQPRFKEHFGDLSGIIRKISDTVHVNISGEGIMKYDFIDFEKFPESWGSDFLGPLVDAIRNKQVIEIYYQPFYEEKPYFIHVHPYLLKEYQHRWYLIGLNDQKKELRTYGLDRIWEIKNIDKPYIPKNFQAKEYFKNTVGVISPTGTPPKIKISVKKPQAFYLITQPLHLSQGIDYEDDSNIIFTYFVHPTYEFKSILLKLGSDLKVLEPKSLQSEIIKELIETLDEYKDEKA